MLNKLKRGFWSNRVWQTDIDRAFVRMIYPTIMEFEVSLRPVLRNIGNVDQTNISSFQETRQNPSKAIKH